MKSSEQILAAAHGTIARMHNRPSMYIGSTSRQNSADIFDGMIWIAHWFWATIQSRENEFITIVATVRETHQCSSLGFPDAFRRHNPISDDELVFQHVRRCWTEIDAKLGIDVSEEVALV